MNTAIEVLEKQIPTIQRIDVLKWMESQQSIPDIELQVCIENHVWITARKQKLFVREMSTSHIRNCIKCLNGKGKSQIPDGYLGGKEKWLGIFKQELSNRS